MFGRKAVPCSHLDTRVRGVAGFLLIWREGFAHMTDTICDTKLACGRVEIRTGIHLEQPRDIDVFLNDGDHDPSRTIFAPCDPQPRERRTCETPQHCRRGWSCAPTPQRQQSRLPCGRCDRLRSARARQFDDFTEFRFRGGDCPGVHCGFFHRRDFTARSHDQRSF